MALTVYEKAALKSITRRFNKGEILKALDTLEKEEKNPRKAKPRCSLEGWAVRRATHKH